MGRSRLWIAQNEGGELTDCAGDSSVIPIHAAKHSFAERGQPSAPPAVPPPTRLTRAAARRFPSFLLDARSARRRRGAGAAAGLRRGGVIAHAKRSSALTLNTFVDR